MGTQNNICIIVLFNIFDSFYIPFLFLNTGSHFILCHTRCNDVGKVYIIIHYKPDLDCLEMESHLHMLILLKYIQAVMRLDFINN